MQTDLGEVIGRALRLAEADLKAKNIAVAFKMEPNFPLVRISTERLTQALAQSFFSMLFQAMDAGGTLRAVTHTLPAGIAGISVGDTGPGIPAEIRASIFTPILPPNHREPASGLPLSTRLSRGMAGA